MVKMKLRTSTFLYMLVAALFCFGCGQDNGGATSNAKRAAKSKIVFNSDDEVKEFIRNNLAQPIPNSYKIPKYISSGLPLEQVYDTLEVRYPGFYGKEGDDYLQAIKSNPETYLEMSLESKSIRRYYDPNSKY